MSELDLGGTFYETFVAAEIARQISWLDDRPEMFHFRDRDQREVDLLLEHRDGSVTAVEIKASATVDRRDLRGLAHLRDKLGGRFKAGALVYAGASTVPFGDRLAAVRLSGLWSETPSRRASDDDQPAPLDEPWWMDDVGALLRRGTVFVRRFGRARYLASQPGRSRTPQRGGRGGLPESRCSGSRRLRALR